MNTTVNNKSDEIIRLLIDPRRDLSDPEEQTVSSHVFHRKLLICVSRQMKKTKCLLSIQTDLLGCCRNSSEALL